MRIFTEGFESGSIMFPNPISGSWPGIGAGRKDVNGNGGIYSYRNANVSGVVYFAEPFPLCFQKNIYPREFWFRCAVSTRNPSNPSRIIFSNSNRADNFSIDFHPTSKLVEIRNSSNSVIATSSNSYPVNQWVLVEVHAYIHNENGFVKVYLNNDINPIVEVTEANTGPHNVKNFGILGMRDGNPSSANGGFDDIGINSITLRYTNRSGSFPEPGEVITGQTSGATAIVTAAEENGIYQRLWIENVSIDPNPFENGEIISGNAGFSAEVYAPTDAFEYGLEPQSWRLGDGYVVGVRPNGDDVIMLQGSDGDQINNYQLVDDAAGNPNTTDYVYGSSAGLEDLYDIESFTDIGFSVGQVQKVSAVNLSIYAKRTGIEITHAYLAVKSGETVEYNGESLIGTDWSGYSYEWSYNPDTDDEWTEADVNSLIAGFKYFKE